MDVGLTTVTPVQGEPPMLTVDPTNPVPVIVIGVATDAIPPDGETLKTVGADL